VKTHLATWFRFFFFFFAHEHLVVPAPFVEKYLLHCVILVSLPKITWINLCEFVLGLSVLFHFFYFFFWYWGLNSEPTP
jgi:hypothetical protein